MMESCSRSKLKLENHNDRPRLASHWGYNCSIGFDLFFLTFKWHIYHWSILYSPTVWWKKFAAVLWYSPHADDGIEQLGPRLFSIWGNIFTFSVMGGSLERWQCCVLREVPSPTASVLRHLFCVWAKLRRLWPTYVLHQRHRAGTTPTNVDPTWGFGKPRCHWTLSMKAYRDTNTLAS